jgi:hypothetical protein
MFFSHKVTQSGTKDFTRRDIFQHSKHFSIHESILKEIGMYFNIEEPFFYFFTAFCYKITFCLRRPGGTLFVKTAPPEPPRKNF